MKTVFKYGNDHINLTAVKRPQGYTEQNPFKTDFQTALRWPAYKLYGFGGSRETLQPTALVHDDKIDKTELILHQW